MKQPDVNSAKRFLRPITYGIASGAVACFLLLLVMATIMGLRDMPATLTTLFATISFVAGGFVAGYVTAAFSREKGLVLGLCCGGILFLALFCAGLAYNDNGFGVQGITKLISVLLASSIGGILGVNKKKKFH